MFPMRFDVHGVDVTGSQVTSTTSGSIDVNRNGQTSGSIQTNHSTQIRSHGKNYSCQSDIYLEAGDKLIALCKNGKRDIVSYVNMSGDSVRGLPLALPIIITSLLFILVSPIVGGILSLIFSSLTPFVLLVLAAFVLFLYTVIKVVPTYKKFNDQVKMIAICQQTEDAESLSKIFNGKVFFPEGFFNIRD